jgi:hypothetical protein
MRTTRLDETRFAAEDELRQRAASGLFNSSLDGNRRRAIDVREGETLDEEALKTLVRAAALIRRSR